MRGDGDSSGLWFPIATIATATQIFQQLPPAIRKYVITGADPGNNFYLPNATQMPFGTIRPEIVIHNASSEFVGLHLFGTAAYVTRLPPRGSARFILTSNATAAGTWSGGCTDLGADSRGNLVLYGNFATYATNTTANGGGSHFANGAGAISRSTYATDDAIAAVMGFRNTSWYGCCGTTDNGYAYVGYGGAPGGNPSGFGMLAGPYSYEAKFSLDALPTAGENYYVTLGFQYGATDRATLLLDRTRPNPTNYYLDAAVGGAHTYTDSGVAAAARTPTLMRVEKTRAGNRQDMWIDGIWRCQSAGGPTGALYCPARALIYGVATASGTTRGMCVGYHRVVQAPAVPII